MSRAVAWPPREDRFEAAPTTHRKARVTADMIAPHNWASNASDAAPNTPPELHRVMGFKRIDGKAHAGHGAQWYCLREGRMFCPRCDDMWARCPEAPRLPRRDRGAEHDDE